MVSDANNNGADRQEWSKKEGRGVWTHSPNIACASIGITQIYQLLFIQLYSMGSFRSSPDLKKHSKTGTGNGFTYAVTHMCGWRIYMEDAHIDAQLGSDKKNAIFGVFDGHGGAEVSTFVERHFVQELQANKSYQNKEYEKALKETFLKMDELLASEIGKKEIVAIQKQMKDKENGSKYDQDSHAGCTANVVLITPEFVYCANAGDSRSVCCVKGETKQLSKDHKPEDEIELSRIKKAGGTVSFGRVNGGLNLSRALGDHDYKKEGVKPEEQMISPCPDFVKIKNENIDFIIMGCDGIWEVRTNSEMVSWVGARLNSRSNQEILEELLDSLVSKDSNNQYGMDNMSSILIRFDKRK